VTNIGRKRRVREQVKVLVHPDSRRPEQREGFHHQGGHSGHRAAWASGKPQQRADFSASAAFALERHRC
jgi:hypothetical protein